jgi:hypothetical protein
MSTLLVWVSVRIEGNFTSLVSYQIDVYDFYFSNIRKRGRERKYFRTESSIVFIGFQCIIAVSMLISDLFRFM